MNTPTYKEYQSPSHRDRQIPTPTSKELLGVQTQDDADILKAAYPEWYKLWSSIQSPYPSDFIPKDGEVFVGVDMGSPDGDYTVKGFFKDGAWHIQSFERDQ